jgi:hypothetical protein
MAKTITMFGEPGITGSISIKSRSGVSVDTQLSSELADGLYTASFSGLDAGTYIVYLVDSNSNINWIDVVAIADADTNYYSKELEASPSAVDIADSILVRNVSNVEATAGEHTLATVILSMLEWEISGSDLIIKRTDGTTVHYTKTLSSTTGSGDVITGLN